MFGLTTEAVPANRFGETARRDRWWLAPVLTGAGLTAFGIYSLVVAAMGSDYLYTGGGAHYLSPFYSPDLKSWGLHLPFYVGVLRDLGAARLPAHLLLLPQGVLPLVLPLPARVRGRRAEPRAATAARPGSRSSSMNVHRYFLYLATVVLGFLWYDAVRAFFFRGADGSLQFGVGLGSLVLLANVVLLSLFTFGCNSLATSSAAGSTASRAPPPRGRGTSSGVASAC